VLRHGEFVVIERLIDVILDASGSLRGAYERNGDCLAGDAGVDAKYNIGRGVNAVSESVEFYMFHGDAPFGD